MVYFKIRKLSWSQWWLKTHRQNNLRHLDKIQFYISSSTHFHVTSTQMLEMPHMTEQRGRLSPADISQCCHSVSGCAEQHHGVSITSVTPFTVPHMKVKPIHSYEKKSGREVKKWMLNSNHLSFSFILRYSNKLLAFKIQQRFLRWRSQSF